MNFEVYLGQKFKNNSFDNYIAKQSQIYYLFKINIIKISMRLLFYNQLCPFLFTGQRYELSAIINLFVIECTSLYRQQHRRNQMDQDVIWTEYSNQPKGKKLYQSNAILSGTDTLLNVTLYEKLIMFDNMCIQYTFDLKFAIKNGTVKFQFQHRSMGFALPKNDQNEWKSVLKLYINQKGFHEAFKPIKKIGKGNFASVYLVQKIENKQKYAVKAFSKEAAYSQQNGKQCLIKQIEIMRNLNHRSLMKLEEVFQSDNSLYIVFELLEGGQLYDKIKQKYSFKLNETKTIMRDLLQGLREMHSKGIMHRDLKPQNILLRSKNSMECVIADFGLSQFANSEQFLFVRCGTPGYVAPEVINIKDMKQKYGPICDVFSLGLIFHILLFGFSVFRKKTYNEVLAENRACSFTFDDQVYEEISSQTLDLLKKMLRVNPQQRITVEQALDHPYFKIQNPPERVLGLKPKISMASTADGDQPTPKKTAIDKDSCLELHFGNASLMTGKTDTVADTGKTKVSMFGQAMTPGRVSKITKFTRQL